MSLAWRQVDERPVLAVLAVVGTGIATFFAAVFLLGGTGQANPGTEALWTTQLRQSNSRSAARTPPPALLAADNTLLMLSGAGLAAVGPDGETRWVRDVRVDDRIFFPDSGFSLEAHDDRVLIPVDDSVSAVDLGTGETAWTETHDAFIEAMAASDEAAFAVVHQRLFQDPGATLVARELSDGRVRWERRLDEERVQLGGVVAADETVFVAFGLLELDEETGEPTPAGGRVLALDTATGQERWRTELAGTFALSGGTEGAPLMASTGGALVALAPATGAVLWEWSDASGTPHDLRVTGEHVAMVVDTSGDVRDFNEPTQVPVVLDASDGREIWRGEPEFSFAWELAGDHVVVAASHGPATSFGPVDTDADLSVRELPSGDVIWQRTYRTETPWQPLGLAVTGDTLFISESNGAVHAVTLEEGEALWSVDASGGGSPDAGPLATGDSLYLIGDDGALRSLSLADGDERWSALHSVRGASPPALDDRHVYAATGLGIVRAYDRATGEEVWETEQRHALNETGAPRPAVTDDTVVVADPEGELVALDTSNGTERWTRPATDVIGTTGAGTDVVVATTGGELTAIDGPSGEDRWTRELGASLQWGPVTAGRVVLVASSDGEVIALSASDGALAWSFDSGESRLALPAVDAATAYLRVADRVVALNLRDGSATWETAAAEAGSFVGGVVIGAGRVFVASSDLGVVALSATSGEQVDRIDVAAPIRWLRAGADGVVAVMTADGELRAYR